ncbi:hypothetical protein HJC23_010428 [Cyclotella cryptica]|uniref:50S ribosomal protein L33 n=1 Tax=Cyclotella cryptica TaxID=29204 RepID=A0ABD3QH58_9STRA
MCLSPRGGERRRQPPTLDPIDENIMQPTAILQMARGKGKTIPIKLLSTAGTGYFYTTRRNVTRTPEKFKFVKFDPVVRRRVLFTEHKIK